MGKRVAAIVPAAGRGVRMGAGIRKQFLELGGVPILVHSLNVLQQSPAIAEIILVVPEADREYCSSQIIPTAGFQKVSHVIAGGVRRQDSVRNGMQVVSAGTEFVLIHDAVRPFLTGTMVEQSVAMAKQHGAAIVAVPMRDTVKKVNQDGVIEATLDRRELWLAQTPQVFRLSILMAAHQRGEQDGVDATDDAFLVERMGQPVMVVNGSSENIKMTRPEDLVLGEAIVARHRGSGDVPHGG